MDWAPAPRKLPFSKKLLSKRVILSYIFDYVIIVLLVGVFFALDKIPGYRQPFSLENISLKYPYAVHERISVLWLVVISCLCPAIIIAVYTLVIDGLFSHQPAMEGRMLTGKRQLSGKYRWKDRLWELNCGILGLMLSCGMAFTITGALKNAIGKPRPDVISRCNPEPGTKDPEFGLSNYTICRGDHFTYIMNDGFRSWPSGHSSTAFGGLWFLSLYLSAKLHVMDSRGEVWKLFVVMIPGLAAILVAGSRIMDARHHPFDVITGGLLGVFTAWASYRQYFPPISESWKKGRAFPIRSWGRQPEPPAYATGREAGVEPLRERSWKAGDEEQGLPAPGLGRGDPAQLDDDHGGNVFRQQVSASQRARAGMAGAEGAATEFGTRMPYPSSTYSTDPSGGPLAPTRAISTRRGRNDGYYESSSEDEGIELQQTYTLSNPQGPYDPMEDTGYHPSRGKSVKKPTVPRISEGSGDLGSGMGRA